MTSTITMDNATEVTFRYLGPLAVGILFWLILPTGFAHADHEWCGNADVPQSLVSDGGSYGQSSYYAQSGYVPPPPVPTLFIKNISTNAAESAPATFSIGPNDEIQLRWTSTNAPTSCTASAVTADTEWSTENKVAGTDTTVTEPLQGETRTYKVSCTRGSVTGSDTIAVTRQIAPPDVSLYGRTSSGAEKTGTMSINSSDQITLRWEAIADPAHAAYCTASAVPSYSQGSYTPGSYYGYAQAAYGSFSGSSGPGGYYAQSSYYAQSAYAGSVDKDFSINYGIPSGSDSTVMEPSLGSTRTYSVTCTNGGGSDTASLAVTKLRPPVVSLFVQNLTSGDAETPNNITIAESQEISLRWTSTNQPTSCTASANPADSTFATGGAVAGTDATVLEPAVGTERTYTVSCAGPGGAGSDSLRVGNPAQACTLDGVSVANGSSRTFQKFQQVPAGKECEGQLRMCTDGVLSGDSAYMYAKCEEEYAPLSDISLRADPALVRYGGESTITWDGGNADACTISNDLLGEISPSGSQILTNVFSETKVVLTCTLGTETKVASTTIKVVARYQESLNDGFDILKSKLAALFELVNG
jgi:hypothetical protein